MAHYRSLSYLALLASVTLPLWMSAPASAQLYDPGEQVFSDGQIRVYIDPKGQRVTMDRHGRIIAVEPGYGQEQTRGRRGVRGGGNWTLNGPVDGGAPYDGFGNVPEDPNYYPAAPSAPDYTYNRDGQIERNELPPVGSDPYDQASIPDYEQQNRQMQQQQRKQERTVRKMKEKMERRAYKDEQDVLETQRKKNEILADADKRDGNKPQQESTRMDIEEEKKKKDQGTGDVDKTSSS